MNDPIEPRGLFDPPRRVQALPPWIWLARSLAIGLCVISAYTAIAGVLSFAFAGSPLGIGVSMGWAGLAIGLAYLARRLGRQPA